MIKKINTYIEAISDSIKGLAGSAKQNRCRCEYLLYFNGHQI